MSQQPNSQPNGQIYNGGPPFGECGHIVTIGQYALDWITALGGSVTLGNQNKTIQSINMPLDPSGVPVALPQGLVALTTTDVQRQSLIAAVQGKVWPPLPCDTTGRRWWRRPWFGGLW
jgi:hypothetical protein